MRHRRPLAPLAARLLVAVLSLAFAFACGDTATEPVVSQGDRTVYPDGPFGTTIDARLENFEMQTVEGEPLTLQDIRADTAHRVLYINTAAGWCAACREEQPVLNQLMADLGDRGLVILVALFEDNNNTPATAGTVRQWVERYDSTYLVVPDPGETFGAFYDRSLTPMNLVVDLDTMTIAYISTGTDVANVRRTIETLLR